MTKTFPSMPLEYHIQDLVGSVVVELSNSCLKNGKTCKNQTEKNELNKKGSGFWHCSVSLFTQNRSWIFIFSFSWLFIIGLVHIIYIIILYCTTDVKITFNALEYYTLNSYAWIFPLYTRECWEEILGLFMAFPARLQPWSWIQSYGSNLGENRKSL